MQYLPERDYEVPDIDLLSLIFGMNLFFLLSFFRSSNAFYYNKSQEHQVPLTK